MPKEIEKSRDELKAEVERLQQRVHELQSKQALLSSELCSSSEEIHKIAIDSLIEGVWIINKDANTVFVNGAMADILGYTTEEMLGRHLFDFMNDDVIEQCKKYIEKRKVGIKEVHDFVFMHKKGFQVYCRISTYPVNSSDGSYLGAVATIVDVSDIHILQERLHSEFDNAPVGIVHMDLSGNILRVNKAFSAMMSFSAKELVNMSFLDITHPDDREECSAHKESVLNETTAKKLIKRHITKDQRIIWLEVSFSVERDEHEIPEYIVVFVEDITAQKRSEQVLGARLHLMNYAAGNSLGDLLVETANTIEKLTESKISFFHLFEDDEELVDLQRWSTRTTSEFCKIEVIEKNYPLCAAGIWADSIHSRKTVVHNDLKVQKKMRFPDGHPVLIREMTTPVIRNERVVAVLGVGNKIIEYSDEDVSLIELLADFAWDIAERKKNEEKLRLSEQRFKKYFDLGLVGMAVLNADGSWQYYNNRLCEILGYSYEELSEVSWQDITYYEDIEENRRLMDSLRNGLIDNYSLEKRYLRKDGAIIHVAVYATCTRKEDGSLEYIMGHILDVTESVKAKEQLQESKDIQDKILTGIKAGIMIIDPETRVVEFINSVALDIFDVSEEDVLGKTCDVFRWKKADGHLFTHCPAREKSFFGMQLRARKLSGQTIPISKTVISASYEGKTKFVEIVFDISEQKDLERRLSLAQKMEALGNLSAGIAHEINTPAQYLGDNIKFLNESFAVVLNAIMNVRNKCRVKKGCELFKNDIFNSDMEYFMEEIPTALEQSEDGVNRIISIVKAMKVFAHPAVESFQSVDINAILLNTVTVCRNEWKYNSEVVFDLDHNLPTVPCYANDISQVFLNVIVNSAHTNSNKYASGNELGLITIRSFVENGYAVIEVEDTGEGIADENLDKVFNPFFTTKDVGKGTGQGLTLCYSIVNKKHKGSIAFTSNYGEGTTCRIKLPLKVTEVSYEQ